ncbi:Pyruvate/2-oxoglutarate/acetoin dehydrogenase complex, dehydrogenase (E1) component [Robiginitalea myxolifaciens]|uniref:3-methyl-2-oxobutanoate dehydrogenase (2-methylpropanoyl-transferring) n=1 Tax=Robiginitalea myxolifaciens TaxID=400055 RepID=A0A1I6GZP0_9FLAO|nr:alpha-ketoacid dehydrogenase subunit alpha/beta [Robiginitalea myxolifaciens]SFR47648.1 Pyruvate/2-oxoglutarate/acetoin dehydrogenase complex, dehydrogenase (E1) component [Robiginitalea myxolifaciens]
MKVELDPEKDISFNDFKEQILRDYRIAVLSRECSLLGRREVLTGKAKFGIFGDGKELPQLAMARSFRDGDFRSGYYRDQTFMMALDLLGPKDFFHGLYATTDISLEPMSAGRQMGGHFVTYSLNEDGSWKDLTKQPNSSADISPTAAQMPRLLGLAQASKLYRHLNELPSEGFSNGGNEIAWGTIGNASTSEGHFFETVNAAGVLQVPMVISVWDDAYGISVPAEYQTTKENISEILKGFQRTEKEAGFEIMRVKGWDYTALIHAYENAADIARESHTPVLIHVQELTQPQGHSTSGSHERYKTEERLNWEREYDCNLKFREWILANEIVSEEELAQLEKSIKKEVRLAKKEAWSEFLAPHRAQQKELVELLDAAANASPNRNFIRKLKNDLIAIEEPLKKDLMVASRKAVRFLVGESHPQREQLIAWIEAFRNSTQPLYSSHLYSELDNKATAIPEISPAYTDDAEMVDGRIILRDNFEKLFTQYPQAVIFGEDSGNIGDVNQGLEGLQKKFGPLRIADTGIREATIIGQGIGLALRGLRPIAEIQYLDYMLYALQTLSDDLATLLYRTVGKQKAPLIVRTRGHRLEGIWHSGSQMGGLIHLLRGMYFLVPRNMTKAAGFYNTLMKSDEPALIVESLNGYRLKEKMPNNLGELCTPIGQVEVIREGSDITILSYGSTLRIVNQVAAELEEVGISAEVIDAQSLLPFDLGHQVKESIRKTNRFLVVDEDVPGGCAAYLLQKVIEEQGAYRYLDSPPHTLTAKAHRPAYASDGDYFSKPSAEDIFEKVYSILHEAKPEAYPKLF